MTELTVWVFPGPRRARRPLHQLAEMSGRELGLHDGASVEWPVGAAMPRARQLHDVGGTDVLDATFWDLLFGLVFLVPVLAEAADTSPAALWASLADVGIDHDFIAEVRRRVVPGTSALCVLGEDELSQRLSSLWGGTCGEPVVATVPPHRRKALHDVFSPVDGSDR